MPEDKRVFTYEEALASFPTVRQLTEDAVRQAEALLEAARAPEEPETGEAEIESAYQEIVGRWARRVVDLGCEAKGLWLVDWDNGDGYYCWRYPEETLSHFHSYEDGFQGRLPIQ